MSLQNHWYIAATEHEVRKKPRQVSLFGQHYVLFAAADGGIAALQDRCPHRNVPLSAGKNCKGEIQCPYHGWRFNSTGKLSHIPALQGQSLPEINIPTAHCTVQDGYVWLCVGTPVVEKPQSFPHLGESGWHTFRMRTRFRASVAQCLENFLDCPHAVYVHTSWFRAPTHKPVRVMLRHLADGAEAEYLNEPREKSVVWKMLQNSSTEMRHTDRFIAPNTSRVDYCFSDKKHYIITSSCTPISDTETEVFTVISFKYGRFAPLVRLFFQPLAQLIIRQDVDILQKQYDNIARFGGEKRFYRSQVDILLPAICAWREAIENDTPPPVAGQEEERVVYL